MKPFLVLLALIIGLFTLSLGFILIKDSKPRTAEEVRLQLQLDDDRQQHEVQMKQLELDRDLALNQQQLNYQSYLQQQALSHDAKLEQLRLQQQLAVEQRELERQLQIEQQKRQAEVALKQIEATTKYTLNQQKLSAESTQLGMKLAHDATMQKQMAESIESRIYLVSGAGVALILVLSASGAALFLIWRRSKVELLQLKHQHESSLEERHLAHAVRMKVLDVITQFPSTERADIIAKLVSSTPAPAAKPIVINPRQTEVVQHKTARKASTSKPRHRHLKALALMPVQDSKPFITLHLQKKQPVRRHP